VICALSGPVEATSEVVDVPGKQIERCQLKGPFGPTSKVSEVLAG
jgi:hypothetical protein